MKKISFVWTMRFFAIGVCMFGMLKGVVFTTLFFVVYVVADVTFYGQKDAPFYQDESPPDKLSAIVGLCLAMAFVAFIL